MAWQFLVGAMASNASSILGPLGQAASMAGNWIAPINQIPFAEVLHLHIKGHLDLQSTQVLCQLNGFNMESLDNSAPLLIKLVDGVLVPTNTTAPGDATALANRIVTGQVAGPSVDETVQMYYRKFISKDVAHWLMQHQDVTDANLRDLFIRLGEQIPGPSDLIRMAVREAFTPAIVSLYHYQDELPMDVLPWMEKQGFGGDTGIPRPAGINSNGQPLPPGNATWFDLYWWSHWELPSVGEGYTMAQRLYPASRFGPSPDSTANTIFSTADLSTLLKTNDYPTYWRERLEAISYNPLGRVDVRRMFATDVLSESEVYHAYRAMGYNDRNAGLLLTFAKKQKQTANIKLEHILTKQQVINYYKAGVMAVDTARNHLVSLGVDLITALTLIREAGLQNNYEEFETTMKSFKKAYMDGIMSDDQLTALLAQANVEVSAVPRYLRIWRIERDYQYKAESTGQILSAFKTGVIDITEMTARLFNLHYHEKSVSMIVRTAVTERNITLGKQIDKANATDAKAIDKQAKDEAKQLDKANKDRDAKAKKVLADTKAKAKEAAAKHKEELARVLAVYTDKNIIAMHKAGVLPEDQIRNILTLKGLTETEQNKWIATFTPPTTK